MCISLVSALSWGTPTPGADVVASGQGDMEREREGTAAGAAEGAADSHGRERWGAREGGSRPVPQPRRTEASPPGPRPPCSRASVPVVLSCCSGTSSQSCCWGLGSWFTHKTTSFIIPLTFTCKLFFLPWMRL